LSEDLVCSDLCEEHGFLRQAEVLRSLAAGQGTAYVVMERGAEYNDEIMDPWLAGEPRTVFLDRGEAERVAAARNANWLCENHILDFCYRLQDVTEHSAEELSRRISNILGRPFLLENDGHPTFARADGPLITGPATDQQKLRIAELFTLKFFYVAETRFAAPEPGLPLSDEASPREDPL
jgi:hypothetical protein